MISRTNNGPIGRLGVLIVLFALTAAACSGSESRGDDLAVSLYQATCASCHADDGSGVRLSVTGRPTTSTPSTR